MKKQVYKKGYSLIETVVYLSLFSFIIGGGVASAFYLTDSMEKVKSRGDILEEGNFVLHKIYWIVSQAKEVYVIQKHDSKYDVLAVETYNSETIEIYLKDGSIVAEKEGKKFVISNFRYVVNSFLFNLDEEKHLLKVGFDLDGNYFSASYMLLP